jgi:hypothetical protein
VPTRRLGQSILQVNGPALEELVEVFSSPYDLHHPNHVATVSFPPAEEYIKTIGHITRAYLDPDAWVRELSFDLIISSITFESIERAVLDELTAMIKRNDPLHQVRPSYPFNYHDLQEDGSPNYDPRVLAVVAREQLFDLIEADAHGERGRRIFDLHKPSIDAAFGRFFARVEPRLRVIEVRYAIIPYGFGYDQALPAYRDLRSPEELGPVRDRGLVGLFRHVAGRDGGESANAFTPLSPLPAAGDPLIDFPEIRLPESTPRWVSPPLAAVIPLPAGGTGTSAPASAPERYVPTEEWLAELGTPSHDEDTIFRHLAVLEEGGVGLLRYAPWGGRLRPLLVVAPDWTHVMVLQPLAGSTDRWVASDWVESDRAAVLTALSEGRPITVAELRAERLAAPAAA